MAPLPPFDDKTTLLGQLRNEFLEGVYNDTYETLFNGGPKCYSESPLGFKMALNLILVSKSEIQSC